MPHASSALALVVLQAHCFSPQHSVLRCNLAAMHHISTTFMKMAVAMRTDVAHPHGFPERFVCEEATHMDDRSEVVWVRALALAPLSARAAHELRAHVRVRVYTCMIKRKIARACVFAGTRVLPSQRLRGYAHAHVD
eukprot:12500241-Alexandrium_andersonii.AAC.1